MGGKWPHNGREREGVGKEEGEGDGKRKEGRKEGEERKDEEEEEVLEEEEKEEIRGNRSLEGTGRSRARRQLAFQAKTLITKEIRIYGNCQVLPKLDSS